MRQVQILDQTVTYIQDLCPVCGKITEFIKTDDPENHLVCLGCSFRKKLGEIKEIKEAKNMSMKEIYEKFKEKNDGN